MWLWTGLALAEPTWRIDAEIGGEIEVQSHGIANLAFERDAADGVVSFALITDTLQARYDRRGPGGRWWAAARAELGAVGLAQSRWIDGRPSPEQSQLGFYFGPEGGFVTYLPGGFYVGAQANLRQYAWAGLAETEEVEPSRVAFAPEALVGWWSPTADFLVRSGGTLSAGSGGFELAPTTHALLRIHPEGRVTPWIELRVGWGERTDIVSQTRLGGLNPYVVPLAGAAWAEFWVEDYVAMRVGPRFHWEGGWIAPVLDAARFDASRASGVGLVSQFQRGPFTVDLGGGVGPWVDRPDGVAWTVYFKLAWTNRDR